jgi:hypothetical protein
MDAATIGYFFVAKFFPSGANIQGYVAWNSYSSHPRAVTSRPYRWRSVPRQRPFWRF